MAESSKDGFDVNEENATALVDQRINSNSAMWSESSFVVKSRHESS